jgi:hypothetical protein
MGAKEGIDPKNLSETGWGVIFPAYSTSDPERDKKQKEEEAIREALQPLFQLRQKQAGDRFRIFEGSHGYRSGADTKNSFLARYGQGPGPADPDRVPYYLLLAGSFQQIPYRFQYQLDVQYAVGRIYFDTLEEYAAYAATVVAVERETARGPRRVVVFGVSHPDDPHTAISTRDFARPLVDSLARLLQQDDPPGLLITSGHGMAFPADDPHSMAHQGALLCAEWPGPVAWQKPIPQEFYFSADDVTDAMQLRGMIALHYSSFSAGTGIEADIFRVQSRNLGREAAGPGMGRVARLAQRLLAQPRGGALAVVGPVERAWGYAWVLDKERRETQVTESVLMRLLDGHPIGSALEFFNERYAELSTLLSDELEEINFGKQPDPLRLAQMWTGNNDSRSFALVGDPAVRLAVEPARAL